MSELTQEMTGMKDGVNIELTLAFWAADKVHFMSV